MIHNDIQNQLALLIKTSAPPLLEVADSPVETPQWVPGQRLPAHVIASAPNGRFQVQVDNQMLDMNLPRNTQPGETLELTFIASSPRLTFALTQDLAKNLPAPANSGVTISDTARFIGGLLQKNGEAGSAARSESLTQGRVATAELAKAAAVVPGAPPPIREFAQALRTAVSQSGLFYESHQAQWVSGERTLNTLLQEPQARLSVPTEALSQLRTAAALIASAAPQSAPQTGANLPSMPGAAANPAQPSGATATPPMPPIPGAATPDTAAASSTGAAPRHDAIQTPTSNHPGEVPPAGSRDFGIRPQSAGTDSQNPMPVRDPVHPLAQPVVQQQLDTLETRQVIWQGQVWPGQQMDWEIDEDGSRQTGDEEPTPGWRTRLHLDMPTLGGVTARLVLDAGGVRVDFSVEHEDTAALMRGDIGTLAQSMEASGLKVAGVMVQRDGAS